MPGAGHPGGNDVTGGGVSGGDVLASLLPVVASGGHPPGHVSMEVLVSLGEVRGPTLGRLVEQGGDVQGWQAEAQTLLVDQTIHRCGHGPHVLSAGGSVSVGAGGRGRPDLVAAGRQRAATG